MTERNSPIPLIYESITPSRSPKDSIIDYLDTVEKHVERLRREAAQLEEDRDTIFITLDTLRHSQALEDLSESEYPLDKPFFFFQMIRIILHVIPIRHPTINKSPLNYPVSFFQMIEMISNVMPIGFFKDVPRSTFQFEQSGIRSRKMLCIKSTN